MKKFLHIILLLALVACSKTEEIGQSKLVVEGWIETGGHPVVMVSESIGVATGRPMSSKDILAHIAKFAKVTVSDGTTTEVLTGTADSRYFPPYIFTSPNITGKEGGSYTLKVEYKDYKAEATTTIPRAVPIENVYVQSYSDTTATLRVGFTDPPEKGNYYKIFLKTEGEDVHYHPSALSTLSDEFFNGYTEAFVYSTQRFSGMAFFPNIHIGDKLWIKLYTIDRRSYDFWKNFEVVVTNNNFAQFQDSSMEKNIDGALGYWAGYGLEKEYKFTVTKPNE